MELLARLRDAGLTVTRSGEQIAVAPRVLLTDELRVAIREAKPQLLSALEPTHRFGQEVTHSLDHEGSVGTKLSPIQEVARRQVLIQLEAHPSWERTFDTRFEAEGTLVVTLAIRGVGTGELMIPAERFRQDCLDDYAALLRCMAGEA